MSHAPEDIFDASSLSEEGVDDGRSLWHHRRLQQVAEQREHGMESLKMPLLLLDQDALAQLGKNDEIQYDGRSQ